MFEGFVLSHQLPFVLETDVINTLYRVISASSPTVPCLIKSATIQANLIHPDVTIHFVSTLAPYTLTALPWSQILIDILCPSLCNSQDVIDSTTLHIGCLSRPCQQCHARIPLIEKTTSVYHTS